MRSAAFFPPGLHPVLDGGEGDEDAVVAPEVPTGGLIGETVLDDQSDGQGHDPMGVSGPGRGQVGRIGGKEAAAPGAVVLRVGEPDVAGPPGHRVAQVMQGAGEDPVARAGLTTERAGPMLVVVTARDEFRAWEHLGIRDAQGGVRRVDSRTTHDNALPSQRLFSLILRLRPGFFIP
jgi:hypothetical protein